MNIHDIPCRSACFENFSNRLDWESPESKKNHSIDVLPSHQNLKINVNCATDSSKTDITFLSRCASSAIDSVCVTYFLWNTPTFQPITDEFTTAHGIFQKSANALVRSIRPLAKPIYHNDPPRQYDLIFSFCRDMALLANPYIYIIFIFTYIRLLDAIARLLSLSFLPCFIGWLCKEMYLQFSMHACSWVSKGFIHTFFFFFFHKKTDDDRVFYVTHYGNLTTDLNHRCTSQSQVRDLYN